MIDGGYGDNDRIERMLRAHESIAAAADLAGRIADLNVALSLIVDEETGTTFGSAAADTTVLHWGGNSDVIVLTRPARAITSVTYGGTLSGATMTDGTVIAASDITYASVGATGLVYAIRTPYRFGAGVPLLVTAEFGDPWGETVPDDIVYIVNFMVMKRVQVEKASPAGAVGPDGSVVPLNDVFDDPVVKRVLRKYRVKVPVV